MSRTKPSILCVDDEPNVLDGIRRHLRLHYDVSTATSGAEGLRALSQEPYAAVVSDLRMPEMDGIQFLSRVRQKSPDTTRILLTGNADVGSAASAVNDGAIFRFLTKPCPPKVLQRDVEMAVEQHRLVTAERELLERTLHGSIRMLTEALALANPSTFGQATRVKHRAGEVAARLGAPARWKMEMAAMLSRVAYVTVPSEILERMSSGETLTDGEQAMIDRLPGVSETLLADLPRLEDVRSILRHQNQPFQGQNGAGEAPPVGARILKAVLDLDTLEARGTPADSALDVLRGREGEYDPAVLEALAHTSWSQGTFEDVREVPVDGLRVGMVLLDPVESTDGRLLVAQGQEVSVGLLERLRNFATNIGVKQPLRALVRTSASPAAPAAPAVPDEPAA